MTLWDRITGQAGKDTAEPGTLAHVLARLGGLFGASPAAPDQPGSAQTSGSHVPHHEVAFSVAVIALGAKMAKADGLVTRDEVDAFKRVFKVATTETANVARVFDLARQDVAGYEGYADQLGKLFEGNRRLLQDVLEGLFFIASADDVLHPDEDRFLADVARRFGFTDSEYRFFRSRFVEAEERNPYDVLKVTPDATDEELKKQYRRLVAGNHPDSYIARGMPQEAIDIANRKLASIVEAYGTIARERGLK